MNILVTASQTLVGFVGHCNPVVLVSGIFSILTPDMPLVAGAVLLIGCLAVLFANVMKAAQE